MKRLLLAFVTFGFSELFNLLMPKTKTQNAIASNLDAFNFPRSKEGDPWPIIMGTVMLTSPNTLWFGGFRTRAITVKVKGMFSSKKQVTGYRYYLGLDLGLCVAADAGPVKLLRIKGGKDTLWEGTQAGVGDISINLPNLFGGGSSRGGVVGTATFYPGSSTQPQDAYLLAEASPDCPAYVGKCHLVFKDFYWGNQAALPALAFELSSVSSTLSATYSIMPNGLDLNPMEVLYRAMTQKWGGMGIDVADIDVASWVAAAQVLHEEGRGMSLLVTGKASGEDITEQALSVADAMLYQDPASGKIVAKLIRADYDVETLFELNQSNSEAVKGFTKELWTSTYNQVRVNFKDRSSDYSDSVAPAQDFANVNQQGKLRSTDLDFPSVYDPIVANTLAFSELSAVSVPLYKCTVITNRQSAHLRPGDVVKLSWAPYRLAQIVMRVQRVDLGTLQDGRITLILTQDVFASGQELFAPPPPSGWEPIPTIAPDLLYKQFWELSYWEQITLLTAANFDALTPTQGLLGIGAVRVSPASDYKPVIRLNGAGAYEGDSYADFTPSGTLTAAIGHTATTFTVTGVDAAIDIVVDTLLLVGSEYMYLTAYNVGTGLATVRRAVVDTVAAPHALGDRVWFVGSKAETRDELYEDADSLSVKLLSHTLSDEQSEADVTADVLVMNKRALRPYPPSTLRINTLAYPATVEANDVTVTWRERNRLTQADTIKDEDDSTVTPEAATTYTLKYYEDAVLKETNTGLTVVTDTYVPTGACMLTVELFSVRDSLDSHQKHSYTFEYTPPIETILAEDGFTLRTESNARLLQE